MAEPRDNPPNAVLRPATRAAALLTFLGGIVLVFLLVAAMLIFWRVIARPGTRADRPENPKAVGTSGTGEPRSTASPGGFDPAPRPDSTEDELEDRGGSTSEKKKK